MAVVCSLTSGRSWDAFLGTVARNIWLVTATQDIDLVVHHISGKSNGLADGLSMWFGGWLNRGIIDSLLSHQWCSIESSTISLDLEI